MEQNPEKRMKQSGKLIPAPGEGNLSPQTHVKFGGSAPLGRNNRPG